MTQPRPPQNDSVRRLIQLQEEHNRLLSELRSVNYWIRQIETIPYWRMFSAVTKLMFVLVPAVWVASFVLLAILGIGAALVQALIKLVSN